MMRPLRRLPIRLRLTLAFAAVMAVVLAATFAFVYLQMRSSLDTTIDRGLSARAADVSALIRQADGGLTNGEEDFSQVLTAGGRVYDAPPALRSRPLLSREDVRRALDGPVLLDHRRVPGFDDVARLLATPVRAQDERLVVVVGTSIDERDEALGSLLWLLGLGGPVALLLASLAGYGVAAGALRPVEAMRRRAAGVSVTEPGSRLPVPAADDEISRLGRTLNEMLDRQEAAFARERTFVADASHELRTPLSVLRTELELALRRARTTGELESALRSAAEETDRLSQLAEDLLVIARSDQGALPVHTEEVPVGELLERARERYAQRAAGVGRAIRVEGGATRVLADPLRAEQALGNLLENAIRHGAGEVVLAAQERDGLVEIHVRDGGPGFPAGFIASAFERFTRADAARSHGGAGLGLPIVAAIASAHGGTAGAVNRPEGGADVWLSLRKAATAAP